MIPYSRAICPKLLDRRILGCFSADFLRMYGNRSFSINFTVSAPNDGIKPNSQLQRLGLGTNFQLNHIRKDEINKEMSVDLLNHPNSLPSPRPNADTTNVKGIKKLWRIAKSYLLFYKNGIVFVWKNWRQSKVLLQKYGFKSINELTDKTLQSTTTNVTDEKPCISRSEYQLLLRTRQDIVKLPVFGLIFFVFEELTVFVAILAPSLVPSTCWLPRMQNKAFNKYKNNFEKLVQLKREKYTNQGETGNLDIIAKESITDLSKSELIHLIKILDLKNHLNPIPLFSWSRTPLEKKIKNWQKEIQLDNYLIGTCGGAWNLNKDELILACRLRGINIFKSSPREQENDSQFLPLDILRMKLLLYISNTKPNGQFDIGCIGTDSLDFVNREDAQFRKQNNNNLLLDKFGSRLTEKEVVELIESSDSQELKKDEKS